MRNRPGAEHIRAKREESVVASVARAVSASVTEVLRWVYWWHSAVGSPWEVSADELVYELNRDYAVEGLRAEELQALVSAWQSGAISRETLLHNLKAGEVLPPGRSEMDEAKLLDTAKN